MTPDQFSILGIILAMLVLFIWGRWRYDLVAMLGLAASVLLGVVVAEDAFTGFGHPATMTVALVLVVSHAMSKTGAVDGLAKLITPFTGTTLTHVAALGLLAAVLSAFMNNVGALALLMPLAIMTAKKAERAPGTVLMPLAFASILGGMMTLIGTPPNIIVSAYRADALGAGYSMFDFFPVGSVVVIAGLIFVSLIGWRLVVRGGDASGDAEESGFQIDSYLSEIRLEKGSKPIGMIVRDFETKAMQDVDMQVVGLIRRGKRRHSVRMEELKAGDVLLIEIAPEDIDTLVTKFDVALVAADGKKRNILEDGTDHMLMEAVVSPRSPIEGQPAHSLKLRGRYDANLLATYREGRPYRRQLKHFRFRIGDVLLLYGHKDNLPELALNIGCMPLAERGLDLGRRRFGLHALAIFIAAIGAAAIGLLTIQIALAVAVLGLALTRIVPEREIYHGIDWPVIVLLGAMLPVGGALEATGTTELIVSGIMSVADSVSPVVILAVILIVTMTLSDVLNNAATVILMAPISLGVAQQLGVNPDAFLMAVAIGGSCAFLTPIGHQNNALVMGPGGYRFGDYWRMGLPLEVLIVAVSVPMLLMVWPL